MQKNIFETDKLHNGLRFYVLEYDRYKSCPAKKYIQLKMFILKNFHSSRNILIFID